MSYDQTVGASGGDDVFSGVVVTVGGSSWGGGIRTFSGVVSLVGAIGAEDAGKSGWGEGRSPRCCWIWRRITVCWSWWACISAICWKRVEWVVVSVWKACTRVRNSKADMVMEGLDVVGATGGIVEVVGGATEVASGMGTGGAVSARSSPCSGYGGTGGATMGRAPRGVE